MLKIELVKFEAQDVITASAGVVAPPAGGNDNVVNNCVCGDAGKNANIHRTCPATVHTGKNCEISPLH